MKTADTRPIACFTGAGRQQIKPETSMSAKKPFRPKARRPRGFEDRSGSVLRAERHLVELEDDDGQWLSLRYDHTAPLARFVAENFQDLNKPYRRYQAGDVWRNEKPGPGRFRQFVQCDADTVGAPGPAADAEMIALSAEVMRAVGLADGEYLIRVNDRRILDGVLESIGAAEPERRLRVLRAADKLDRLGRDGVADLLGAGRKDESGDFTQGAGLDLKGVETILAFLDSSGGSRGEVIGRLEPLVGQSEAGRLGLAALGEIDNVLTAIGVGDNRAVFDPSVVRGLGYYTGPVYEAELLAAAHYDDGKPIQFGSAGGGGRYDAGDRDCGREGPVGALSRHGRRAACRRIPRRGLCRQRQYGQADEICRPPRRCRGRHYRFRRARTGSGDDQGPQARCAAGSGNQR